MMNELLVLAQNLIPVALVLSAQLLVVLALRKPVRARLGSIACYWLWMLPLSMPLYFLGDNLVRWLSALAVTATADPNAFVIPSVPFVDLLSLPLDGNTGSGVVQWWQVLGAAWFMGAIALLLWQGGRWWLFNRFVLRQGAAVADASLQALIRARLGNDMRGFTVRGMHTAGLFGIRKPVVLLPESFSDQYDADQQHIILAHEAVHLRRHDNAWNLCATVVLALFWWNPLLWLAWHCFRFDQELSCDAFALRACSDSQQKRYARTLLDSIGTVAGIGPQPALSAWDNLNDMKERIHMIGRNLKTTVSQTVARTVLSVIGICAAVGTLTLSAALTPATAAEATAPVEPAVPAEVQASVDATAARSENAILMAQIIELLNARKFDEVRQRIPELQAGIDDGKFTAYEASRLWQMFFAAYIQSEQYDEARAAMERAIQSGGMSEQEASTGRYQLAQLWMQQENWAKGAELLEQWLADASNPKGNAYYLLAAAYYNLEEFDRALQPAKKAVELDGDKGQESHYQMLSALYMQLEQYDNAIPVIEEQVKRYPEKEQYRAQLGQVYAVVGKFDKALPILSELATAHPDNADYKKRLEAIQAELNK